LLKTTTLNQTRSRSDDVAELWPFEGFHTWTGEQTSDMQVILYSVQCCIGQADY